MTRGRKIDIYYRERESMLPWHAVKLKQSLAMVCDFSIRLQADFAPGDTEAV